LAGYCHDGRDRIPASDVRVLDNFFYIIGAAIVVVAVFGLLGFD